jgi:hypothetical protein
MGSGVVPENTVQAVAVRPRWTSLRGKNPPVEGGGTGIACAASATGQRSVKAAAKMLGRDAAISFGIGFTSIRVQRVAISFQLPAISFQLTQPELAV